PLVLCTQITSKCCDLARMAPVRETFFPPGPPHLSSSIEQDFLAVLVIGGTLQALGLDPALATGLALEQSQGKSADHAQVRRRVIPVDPALVLAEADVQLPVQAVLDAPGATHRPGELLSRQQPTEDVEAGLQAVATFGVGPL